MNTTHPLVAAGAALLILSACTTPQASVTEPTPEPEATVNMYLGTETVVPVLHDDGSVESILFTLPLAAIQNARTALHEGEDPHAHDPNESIRLSLPAEVEGKTFVDHIDIDYNPVGHPPVMFAVPHFDLHLYGISETEQMAIDCSDTVEIPADRLPANHVVTKAGLPPEGECTPRMGHHAFDVTRPEMRQENPEPFTKTMILGYYAGELTFVEPMVTRAELLKMEDFEMEIPKPDVLDTDRPYPRTFRAEYDEENQMYLFTVKDFE